VEKWDTPILIVQGEKDYRVPPEQGMAAFNAAVLRGVPAQMLYFPEENHWVCNRKTAFSGNGFSLTG
jgi:dipeptidyl aminopeptidase/acylaminoacyl peptidase